MPTPNQIDQYVLGKKYNGLFAYRIKVAGGGWSNWMPVPAAEFAAFAALFSKSPLYLHSDGSITTGVEPIKD